jgi:hypothetical protein
VSREGDLLRKALRKHLLPQLRELGFNGKTSTFQRANPDSLDLLSIQYWKYGGEFILEFARFERGELLTSWGEVVPEAKLDVAYVSPLDRARLVRGTRPSGFGGFRFGKFGEDLGSYDQLALEVASLLPQVERWLTRREIGPNISALSAVAGSRLRCPAQ